MANKNNSIRFKINKDLKDEFEEACAANWSTMSHVLTMFVHRYTEEHYKNKSNDQKPV